MAVLVMAVGVAPFINLREWLRREGAYIEDPVTLPWKQVFLIPAFAPIVVFQILGPPTPETNRIIPAVERRAGTVE